jgi:hypothetical protein
MGTTPALTVPLKVGTLVGVLPAVEVPFTEHCMEGGDSELFALGAFVEVGVVAGVCWTEFLREAFLDALVEAVPTGILFPLPRFRFLMTSVFSDRGRTTP